MTTITQVLLVPPVQLANTDSIAYLSPTSTTSKIGRAIFCNTSASAVTITAGVTTGAAIGASTTLIQALTIAPGVTYVSPELAGLVLPAGYELRTFASTTNVVTMTVSGLIVQ